MGGWVMIVAKKVEENEAVRMTSCLLGVGWVEGKR